MKLSQKILIPLILLSCVTLSAVGLASYYSMESEISSIYAEQMTTTLDTLEAEMANSAGLTSYVLGKVDEKNLALSRALAEIVRVNPEILQSTEQMQSLADLLQVDEVHVTDENGVLNWGNVEGFYGFDFATTDQTIPFLEILNNPALEIAQEAQPRGTTADMFQYTGVARTDSEGVVQVGIDASVVSELAAALDIQNKVVLTKIGTTGFTAITRDGAFVAHADSEKIGEEAGGADWYAALLAAPGVQQWVNLDGSEYLASHKQTGDYGLFAFLPRTEFMAGLDSIRNLTIVLILLSALVLIAVLYACMRSFVLKPIRVVTDTMGQVAAGNLGVSIRKKYSGEIGQLTRSINETINTMNGTVHEISDVLGELARDNYDVTVQGEYAGDFRPIKDGLNRIIQRINSVMANVHVSAVNVDHSAQSISHSSVTLSQGATEQSSAVTDLDGAVKDISAHTHAAARTSRKTSDLAAKTADNANRGNQEMQAMLTAMREIQDVSTQIAKVNDVISNIAMQTNLLALNASVEAARAGSQGKGFAVVAEQVGQLAAQSQDAAKNTSRLIENTLSKVSQGMHIADNTASSLGEIVDGVTQIHEMMRQVAAEAEAQESSIQRIHERIEQISGVTRMNSATSDEVALAAGNLTEQSGGFKSLVQGFQLQGDDKIAGYLK